MISMPAYLVYKEFQPDESFKQAPILLSGLGDTLR